MQPALPYWLLAISLLAKIKKGRQGRPLKRWGIEPYAELLLGTVRPSPGGLGG
jgi:hypothetical protein